MDRREAIKKTIFLMGGVVITPAMLASLKGCAPKGKDWTPVVLNRDQVRLVSELAETFLPQTDTPGAIEAGAPAFMDRTIGLVYDENRRENFLNGLERFKEDAKQATGRDFLNLSSQERHEYVGGLNSEAILNPVDGETPFILQFKELAIFAYCNTEAGATQHLRYMQNFGPYRGCIPFEEVGNVWAMP